MSNLPVLWIPPVNPPSPEDRPPRSNRLRGALLAAVALIAAPLLAWGVSGTVTSPPPPPAAATPDVAAPAE
ncbi:MAG: hypothetical protein ABTQ29_05570, partial [Siculibacillus sp.]